MIEEFAPAKVNLGLAVTGRLANGFHSLDTLFVRLNVGDRLTLEPIASGIELSVTGVDLGDPRDNLVYRATAAYLEATGHPGGVRIALEKRLPVAAGLGGGSSDAAAALRGLAHLYRLEWSETAPLQMKDRLVRLGQTLGADVPFFLFTASAARGQRTGDQLHPVNLPEVHLVLANPGVGITAKEAYAGLNGRFGTPLPVEAIIAALETKTDPPYRNDLETPVLKTYPVVQTVKDALTAASLFGVLMSGSGSTCFGLARDATQAEAAAAQIRLEHPTWWVTAAVTDQVG